MSDSDQFPKYLMKINGDRRYLSFGEACAAYDSGTRKVEFGRYVLDSDFRVREMTDEDRSKISRGADEHSDAK